MSFSQPRLTCTCSWNTADDTKLKFQDGGLPCVFCPVNVLGELKVVNTSVTNGWCEIDAFEDVFTIDRAIELVDVAVKQSRPFYLAVGLHKVHCSSPSNRSLT